MLMLLLAACNPVIGPRKALLQAQSAMESGDLASFEQVVDINAVAPQMAEGCVSIKMISDWEERQFRANNLWQNAGLEFGNNLIVAALNAGAEDIAAKAREDFGTDALQSRCEGLEVPPGMPDITVAADTATADLKVTMYDVPAVLPLQMAQTEDGWRVVGVDTQGWVDSFKEGAERSAMKHARELLDALESGDGAGYGELEAWFAQHPEDTAGLSRFDKATREVLEAETPVEVEQASLGASRLLRGRSVRVRLKRDRAVRTVWVRIDVRGVDGSLVMQPEVATVPWMGDEDTFETPINVRVQTPEATQVQATVVKVVYDDLTQWEHPAIERGWWSL